ncbi:hypothetical protein RKD26_001189 [Streptomyces calvus]
MGIAVAAWTSGAHLIVVRLESRVTFGAVGSVPL